MTLEEFIAVALERPDHWADFSGDDVAYGTHGRTISTHRDATVLGQSNWETIKDDLISRFPDDCEVRGSSHWAVGWTDELFVRAYTEDGEPTEAITAAYEWHEALEDYPVANEEDYFQREHEDLLKTLENCYSVPADKVDAVARIISDHCSSSDEINQDAVYEALREVGVAREDIPSWMYPKGSEDDTEPREPLLTQDEGLF